MANLHMDYLGRTRGEKDEKGWVMIERIARVTDLPGMGYHLLNYALRVYGLPAIGDLHPAVADMYVVRLLPEEISKGAAEIRIEYRRRDEEDNPDYGEMSVSTSLIQRDTNKDINGDLLEVEFEDKKQGGTVTIDLPITTMVYRRRSDNRTGGIAEDMVGDLNSGPWNLRPNAVKWEWKFSYFDRNSIDGGQTYDETYTFERAAKRPDGTRTWDVEIVYIDPETGRIPDGVIDGDADVKAKAIKTVTVSPVESDFGALGL